ncbi:MAG: thioether cross-link-forming SCIFF peptide maturase [Firmicutes bacterium HGW-Firmicutes-12]|jgi:uncharacterized protein|nr:MAG: thioether cross-link-forming SCIFF peptide maturase [Firmicutes bacterium HGW-Firmicutes-12]
MAYDFSLLHSFTINDTYIVMDINSGIVHSLSKEAWDFFKAWEKADGDAREAVTELAEVYDSEELKGIHQEMEVLKQEGMLFSYDEALDKYELPEETVVKALCLHVAHDCNLRCTYCFAGTGNFGSERGLMSLETGKQALEFLFKACGPRKHIEIDYFGGEPLLNFEVVQELVHYGKARAATLGKELKQTLTTNAILLDREKIDFLINEDVYMILSIDGRPNVHNRMRPFSGNKESYPLVHKAIKDYVNQQEGDTYFVRGTYTHHNLDFSEDVKYLIDQGFTQLSLEPVVAAPNEDYALKEEDLQLLGEQYEKLAEMLFEYHCRSKNVTYFHYNITLDKGPCLPKRLTGCGAGHEYLAVSPKGDLYPCHQFMGQEEFKIGNLTQGISNLTIGKGFRKAHVLNKEKCRDCWARFLCSGGCHANAHNFNGNIFEPYRIGCEIQKKRLECAIYLQVKKWEYNSLENIK